MAHSACASAASAICRRFWADGAATAAPVQAPAACPLRPTPCPRGKPGRLHHLSLKDNSVIDKLDQLQAIGVASAKIEGRLRTPGMWRRRSAPVWQAGRAVPMTVTC